MVVWKTLLKLMQKLKFKLNFSKNIAIIAIILIANQSIFTLAEASNIWHGTVVHITDGDTLRIRPIGSNSQADSLRVRIEGIDAPEICQQYGIKSAAALKKLLVLKQVTIASKRFDDYGREVAKISFNNVDVGGWMVKNGHAWSYHYKFSNGPYGAEEKVAAREKLGLFADTSAVNPKIFRREHGSCYPAKNNVTKNHAIENDRKRYK